MKIKTIIVGPLETNCYIVFDQNEALIIDPGFEAENIIEVIEQEFAAASQTGRSSKNKVQSFKIVGIVNTHGHWDHIGGNQILQDIFQAPIMVQEADAIFHKQEPARILSWLALTDLEGYQPGQPGILLKEGDEIKVGQTSWKVIHTPGHSPGSICLHSSEEKVLFSGDTLFAEGIGRTDLPGGGGGTIRNSIFNKLFILPDETKVYPGHGPATTIGGEKGTNPDLY